MAIELDTECVAMKKGTECVAVKFYNCYKLLNFQLLRFAANGNTT